MKILFHMNPADLELYQKGDKVRVTTESNTRALKIPLDPRRATPDTLAVLVTPDEIVDQGVHEVRGMESGSYPYYVIQSWNDR